MAVGHAGGAVRVFQFCAGPRTVQVRRPDAPDNSHSLRQGPGLQLVLQSEGHTDDIQALTLLRSAAGLPTLAIADASGACSCVDLATGSAAAGPSPCGPILLLRAFDGDVDDSAGDKAKAKGTAATTLLAATNDGALCLLREQDLRLAAAGATVRPKSAARPLALAVLDDQGRVLDVEGRGVDVGVDEAAERGAFSYVSRWAGKEEGAEAAAGAGRAPDWRRSTSNQTDRSSALENAPESDESDEDAALDAALAVALQQQQHGN